MNPVTIEAAVEIAAQILSAIQNAIANKQTVITPDAWAAAITARNAALTQLDADISAAKGS